MRNDIVNMHTDAIVNTANPKPVIGTGVDAAVHKKAGPELLKAREKIGNINFGEAFITPGFNLDAKYVIHTAGPVWTDGKHGEEEILASCYRNSLDIALKNKIKSIAFPLIASGNYGYPKEKALQTAIREISAFLMENDMMIYLVVFNRESFQISEKLFKRINSYIDENYVEEKICEEYDYSITLSSRRISKNLVYDSIASCLDEKAKTNGKDLEDRLKKLDLGFSETLIKLIDESGKTDPEIYKKANVDRKLFSKIKNNSGYRPSKTTALAFAFALELSLDETENFIGRAGYALSNCSKFDIIVKFFLENKIYDVYELNEYLFKFDQPLIGA